MRYLIADEPSNLWGHIFSGSRETHTRFVYDTEHREMVAVQLRNDATGSWTDADQVETADLLDSLVNANAEAIEAPEAWGLLDSEDVPTWAMSAGPGLGA